jgi:hypothetical protein
MLQKAKPNRKSQSALEYMMTYGWAILIIVIVAGVLYSLGIFTPSSSTGTTITGFSDFGVNGQCIRGGALQMQITNGIGYLINITRINTTGSNGQSVTINTSVLIPPDQSQLVFIPGACPASTGSSYSNPVTFTYKEPGQTLSGPYFSHGTISGVPVSTDPNQVASFNGQSTTTISNIPHSDFPSGSNALTIVAWVKTTQATTYPFIFNYGLYGSNYADAMLGIYSGQVCGDFWGEHLCSTATVSGGTWDFIALSYPGGSASATTYINESGTINSVFATPNIQIGSGTIANIGYGTNNYYTGEISNVQLYSTALSSSQIDKLYAEGLGGAPIPNAGLVGWWPLDGNANDYSGNNNNGVATNVQWVSP